MYVRLAIISPPLLWLCDCRVDEEEDDEVASTNASPNASQVFGDSGGAELLEAPASDDGAAEEAEQLAEDD